MAVSAEFRAQVVEALSAHGEIRDKSMFGGVGLYASELFFAVLDNDRIYFKVDDTNRADFEERGMGPFMPYSDPSYVMAGYYELPHGVIDDVAELGVWMDKSLAVAERAAKKKGGKRK